jgi:hypothetical protein
MRFLPQFSRFFHRIVGSTEPDESSLGPSILTKEIRELEHLVRLGLVFHPSDLVSSPRVPEGERATSTLFQPAYIDAVKNLNGQGIDDRLLLARIPFQHFGSSLLTQGY